MKIVHVTPHLGTGIGAAYAGLTGCSSDADPPIEHEILLLEEPQKPFFVRQIEKKGVRILQRPSKEQIAASFFGSDVVQVNWWNHPLMSAFLYDFPAVPVRLACWVHVSGCGYPYLRADFLEKFDRIFFATPYSYENKEVAASFVSDTGPDERTAILYGMDDFSRFFKVEPERHDGFRIGYVGTLDFSKLHSDFVSFCKTTVSLVDDAHFVLIGDTENERLIRRQAEELGISDRFEYRGFQTDIASELARLDCFGYPLNPFHFGATENVLLEALAAGLPVVALNQNTEKYIIQDGKNGFLVKNEKEYAAAISAIHNDENLRNHLRIFGRKTITERFSIESSRQKNAEQYRNMMNEEKKSVRFEDLFGPQPSDWFLHFVEKGKKEILEGRFNELENVLKGKAKGSIRQFASYFPEDERLAEWASAIEAVIDSNR